MTETPLNILKEWQTIINRFLLINNPPRVEHKSLIAFSEKVGLKSPDIVNQYQALHLAWLELFSEVKPLCAINTLV